MLGAIAVLAFLGVTEAAIFLTAAELPSAILAPSTPAESNSTTGGDLVSVHLRSGRTFEAAIDARTTRQTLWLRFGSPGSEVLREIDWDRVVSVELAGERVSGEQVQWWVADLRKEIPAQSVEAAAKTDIVLVGSHEGSQTPRSASAGAVRREPADDRRVVSLAIEARAARWDENVEPDGLQVRVYPLDAEGAVVPVRGTLTVELLAEQTNEHRLHEPFVNAGNWTEAVRREDFDVRGAVYRLRYHPTYHPAFADHVASRAAVHATLSVPGQGTFEATDDMTVIRPFSAVRNHYQQVTRHGYFPGYRYFPNERTDDGRR